MIFQGAPREIQKPARSQQNRGIDEKNSRLHNPAPIVGKPAPYHEGAGESGKYHGARSEQHEQPCEGGATRCAAAIGAPAVAAPAPFYGRRRWPLNRVVSQ